MTKTLFPLILLDVLNRNVLHQNVALGPEQLDCKLQRLEFEPGLKKMSAFGLS